MQKRLRVVLIFLLYLAASAATYYYALADLPRRDHLNYMAERSFVDSNWEWFWHSVSWSRDRYLQTGDAFLFRPFHMATLAIKDILFRGDIFASGAVNIAMMALAGLSLYLFARRMTSAALAAALSLLFLVQHAGLEIVAWGHISPYLMALSLLGFALAAVLKGTPRSLALAGLLLLAGALFHEFIVAGLAPASLVFLFVMLIKGRREKVGDATLWQYFVFIFVIPLAVYFSLDLIDYILHAQAPVGADFVREGQEGLLSSLLYYPGAAAVAFFDPFAVHLELQKILAWNFGDIRTPVLVCGGTVVIAMLSAMALNIRAHLKGKATATTVAAMVALFMLAGLIAGVGVGRVYLRAIDYLYQATYYYSIISYMFCLFLAMGLNYIGRSRISRLLKRVTGRAVIVAAIVLIAVNFVMVRQTLGITWPVRSEFALSTLKYESLLKPYSRSYCLAGSDYDVSLGPMSLPLWDYFCWPRDARKTVYLTRHRDGSLWLSRIERLPLGPQAKEVQLSPSGTYLLSKKTYTTPDMAVRVARGFHGGVVMGYRGPGDDTLFMMRGSIVYPHKLEGGMPMDNLYLAVVPHLRPWSNIEVRHTWKGIYMFVDDYVLASMDSRGEEPGKTGIYIVQERQQHAEFTKLMAAPSRAGGSFNFIPEIKLADKVPEIPLPQ